MGIRGTTLELFKSYLSDRTQCVRIGEFISGEETLCYGVPQGSILGPTLFLVYINDLCELSVPNCSFITYADDTAMLVHGQGWRETECNAKVAFKVVLAWLAENLLTLNIGKTKYITFSTRPAHQPPLDLITIKNHNCNDDLPCSPNSCPALTRVSSVKYLGVEVDECLNWYKHLDSLMTRFRKLIYIFKQLRNSADKETLTMVYRSLCESILLYCISVWGGAAKTAFFDLEIAQRAILKVMGRKPFRYPTTDLYVDSKVLTVRQLYILRAVLRRHSSLHFNSEFVLLNRRRAPPTVCPQPRANTTFASRHYNCASSRIYNRINNQLNIYANCYM